MTLARRKPHYRPRPTAPAVTRAEIEAAVREGVKNAGAAGKKVTEAEIQRAAEIFAWFMEPAAAADTR